MARWAAPATRRSGVGRMRRQLVCLVLPECIEASEAPQKRMGSAAWGQRGGSSEGRNMLPRCCPPRGHCPECLPVATARALHAPRAARQTRAKALESSGGGAEKPSPRRLKEETAEGGQLWKRGASGPGGHDSSPSQSDAVLRERVAHLREELNQRQPRGWAKLGSSEQRLARGGLGGVRRGQRGRGLHCGNLAGSCGAAGRAPAPAFFPHSNCRRRPQRRDGSTCRAITFVLVTRKIYVTSAEKSQALQRF